MDGEAPLPTAMAGAGNSALSQLGQHLPGMWGHRALRGRWKLGASKAQTAAIALVHEMRSTTSASQIKMWIIWSPSPLHHLPSRGIDSENYWSNQFPILRSEKQKSWISSSAQEMQKLKPDSEWKGWKAPAWDSGGPRTRDLSAQWVKASTKCLPLQTSTKLHFCSILQGL